MRLTYHNVTLPQWLKIMEAASNNGISINGQKGQGDNMGVRFSWDYATGTRTLDIFVNSSMLIPVSDAAEIIDGIVKQALVN